MAFKMATLSVYVLVSLSFAKMRRALLIFRICSVIAFQGIF
jgi:hypothetical protein